MQQHTNKIALQLLKPDINSIKMKAQTLHPYFNQRPKALGMINDRTNIVLQVDIHMSD